MTVKAAIIAMVVQVALVLGVFALLFLAWDAEWANGARGFLAGATMGIMAMYWIVVRYGR